MIYNIIIISRGRKKNPHCVVLSWYSKQTKHKRTTDGVAQAGKRKWTVSTVRMFMNEADPCGFACARSPWVHSSKPCCPSTLAQQQQQHPPVQAGRLHYTPARQSQRLRATLRLTRLKHQKLSLHCLPLPPALGLTSSRASAPLARVNTGLAAASSSCQTMCPWLTSVGWDNTN